MTPLADVTASSSFVRLFALWCQCSEYQETSQYFGANVPRKSSSQGSPNSPFNLRQTFCCPFVGPSIHLADPIFAGEHHHLSSHVRRPIHRFCCWCLTFVRHQKKISLLNFSLDCCTGERMRHRLCLILASLFNRTCGIVFYVIQTRQSLFYFDSMNMIETPQILMVGCVMPTLSPFLRVLIIHS